MDSFLSTLFARSLNVKQIKRKLLWLKGRWGDRGAFPAILVSPLKNGAKWQAELRLYGEKSMLTD
jgi:hypothetical protein